MSARSKARKRALDVLFEADVRGTDPVSMVAERTTAETLPVPPYAITLVEGVTEHRQRIDEILRSYVEGWTLERLPAVDRTILRIGVYELLWVDQVPHAVAINEAVELARSLSTEESPRFVNGVLARILAAGPVVRG